MAEIEFANFCKRSMRLRIFAFCALCAFWCAPNFAATPVLDQETQADIAKHQQIAAAHAAAAKCLASGKSDAECEGALQAACKGIAYGKFCGMKH